MSAIQYSLIPTPCSEKEIRKQFPWIGNRPMMIPSGWLGLVNSTCKEIEALLAPNMAKDAVDYFFVTVRESRLRIFLQISEDLDSEARASAIKSLLNEVQVNCNYVCYICGKESIDFGQYGNRKSTLSTCGDHNGEDDDTNGKPDGNQLNVDGKEAKKNDLAQLDALPTGFAHDNAESIESNLRGVDINQNVTGHDLAIEEQSVNIQLYEVNALRKLLSEASTRYRDKDDVTKIKTILTKLIKTGGERVLKPLPNSGVVFLDQLQADFPNFSKVIDMLRGFNALTDAGEVPRIPVMLLLGPPGVGKTMFAEALAIGMHVPFRVVRMENQQAGAGLVGSADFWSNSKSGIVFDVLTNGDCGNPVIVVDEIDKAASDNRYNPINGLYSLLEAGSASTFHDESLPDVCLNASRITWVLTANFEHSIPEPILSRVRVFEIPKPDLNQSVQVANRIYQILINESASIKARFTNELSNDVTFLLASLSPRKIRLAIEIALGRAALAGRNMLITEDVDIVEKEVERKIGFI